jgi:hypothetical protein
MGRFAYFLYRGRFSQPYNPVYAEPYHFVAKVERDEADKHERTTEELRKGRSDIDSQQIGHISS